MKVFIVKEINYRYNDEYYYETDGGNSVKAFKTRQAAEEEAKALSISHIKGEELFAYEEGDIWNLQNFDEETLSSLDISADEPYVPTHLSDEDAETVLNMLSIQFFTVEELNVVDQ